MARPKGHPKSGGRKAGSLNKRTEDLLLRMEDSGYNPLKSLLSKYHNLTKEDQIKIDLKLMEYVYPKLKEQSLMVDSGDKDAKQVENQFNTIFDIINSVDPKINELFGKVDRFEFFNILASLSAEGVIGDDLKRDQN